MEDEEQKVNYLNSQIENVYLKDIIERNHLKNDKNIGELFDCLASNISTLTNPTKLSNTFKSLKKYHYHLQQLINT